jgi:hypothetical protein
MKVEQLTCSIGAELIGVNLADAVHDDGLFAEIRARCSSTSAVPARPGHHPRRARGLRPPLRRAGRPSRGRQRSGAPGPGAHLQESGQPMDSYENAWHCDGLARKRRQWARCCAASSARGRRRHHVGQHGPGVRGAAEDVKVKDRRPARPPQHRSQLRCRHADRKTSGSWASTRMPSTRWCAPTRRPARRCCSSTPSPRTSQLPHTRAGALLARTPTPARRAAELPDQPGHHPRIPGALALEAQQRRHLGQPQHPALRGHGLPAVPSQDGARRHRRRQAVLIRPPGPW